MSILSQHYPEISISMLQPTNNPPKRIPDENRSPNQHYLSFSIPPKIPEQWINPIIFCVAVGGEGAVCNQDRWGPLLSRGCTGPALEEPQCFKSSSDAGRTNGPLPLFFIFLRLFLRPSHPHLAKVSFFFFFFPPLIRPTCFRETADNVGEPDKVQKEKGL